MDPHRKNDVCCAVVDQPMMILKLMAFTQIMDISRRKRSLNNHLKGSETLLIGLYNDIAYIQQIPKKRTHP